MARPAAPGGSRDRTRSPPSCGGEASIDEAVDRHHAGTRLRLPASPRAGYGLRWLWAPPAPPGSRAPSRCFQRHRRLRSLLTILGALNRIVPRLIARADARNPTGLCPEPATSTGSFTPSVAKPPEWPNDGSRPRSAGRSDSCELTASFARSNARIATSSPPRAISSPPPPSPCARRQPSSSSVRPRRIVAQSEESGE